MQCDGLALISKVRFGADFSPGSTWTIPFDDGVYFYGPGDLVIVFQLAENTGPTPPVLVIPAGWIAIGGGTSFTSGDGKGIRVIGLLKLLVAGDAGRTITGMNGSSKNRVCGMALKFNRRLLGVSAVDHGTSGSAGIPAAIGITYGSGAQRPFDVGGMPRRCSRRE
jgi:hypothetical protein